MKRFHSCNILHTEDGIRRLWQYGYSDGKAVQFGENTGSIETPLPSSWVAKGLSSLWQRRINLAWFPAESVFMRAIQLPVCEPAELPAMIELQLEKLSPLPVAQIVWTAEPLPGNIEGMQNVVVVIAARAQVEEHLGKLEGKGFQADRLEIPVLHQMAAVDTQGEGLWLFPEGKAEHHHCLAAWWSGGTLRNLTLLRVDAGTNGGALALQQLTQMAWAGQMEGWMEKMPACHVVATEAAAAPWAALLRDWAASIGTLPAKTTPELAALNVVRLARDEARINLVPDDYSLRFRQQLIDRIWMGGLFAAMGVYLAGVMIYLGAVEVLKYQKYRLDKAITAITPQYTNAVKLKEQLRIRQEQMNLKFAVLDCWKASCMVLPPELTLTSLTLSEGRVLTLTGTAHAEDDARIYDYNLALKNYVLGETNGHRLFKSVKTYTASTAPGGAMRNWSFPCELNRTDDQ